MFCPLAEGFAVQAVRPAASRKTVRPPQVVAVPRVRPAASRKTTELLPLDRAVAKVRPLASRTTALSPGRVLMAR